MSRNGEDYTHIQCKTFTNWVNIHLKKANSQIADISKDLRDGKSLLLLLEVLCGKSIKPETQDKRIHMISNVQKALLYIDEVLGIKTQSMNIGAEDIVDGNIKITLGLLWLLILRLDISRVVAESPEAESITLENNENNAPPVNKVKQILLNWVETTVERYGSNVEVNPENWKNGIIFSLLGKSLVPDAIPDEFLTPCDQGESLDRLTRLFAVFDEELDIPPIIEPADFIEMSHIDEKILLTYLAGLYKIFKNTTGTMQRRGSLDIDGLLTGQSMDDSDALKRVMDIVETKIRKLEETPQKTLRITLVLKQLYAIADIIKKLHELLQEVLHFSHETDNDAVTMYMQKLSIEKLSTAKEDVFQIDMSQLSLETEFLSLQGKQRSVFREMQDILPTIRDKAFLSLLSFINTLQNRITEVVQRTSSSILKSRQILVFLSTFGELVNTFFGTTKEHLSVEQIQIKIDKMCDNKKSLEGALLLHKKLLLSVENNDVWEFFSERVIRELQKIIIEYKDHLEVLSAKEKRRKSVLEHEKSLQYLNNVETSIQGLKEDAKAVEESIKAVPVPEMTLKNQEELSRWLNDIIRYLDQVMENLSLLEQRMTKVRFGLENYTLMDEELNYRYQSCQSKLHSLENSISAYTKQISSIKRSAFEYIEQLHRFLDRSLNVSTRMKRAISTSQLQDVELDLKSLSLDIPPPSSEIMSRMFRAAAKTEAEVIKSISSAFGDAMQKLREMEKDSEKRNFEKRIKAEVDGLKGEIEEYLFGLDGIILQEKDYQLARNLVGTFRDRLELLKADISGNELCDEMEKLLNNAETSYTLIKKLQKISSMDEALIKLIQFFTCVDERQSFNASSKQKWIKILEEVQDFVINTPLKHPNPEIERHILHKIEIVKKNLDLCKFFVSHIDQAMSIYERNTQKFHEIIEELRQLYAEMQVLYNLVEKTILRFNSGEFSIQLMDECLEKFSNLMDLETFDDNESIMAPFTNLSTSMQNKAISVRRDMDKCRKFYLRLKELRDFAVIWGNSFSDISLIMDQLFEGNITSTNQLESIEIPPLPDIQKTPEMLYNLCLKWAKETLEKLEATKAQQLTLLQRTRDAAKIQLETLLEEIETIENNIPSIELIFSFECELPTVNFNDMSNKIEEILSDLSNVWSNGLEATAKDHVLQTRNEILDKCGVIRKQISEAKSMYRISLKLREISDELDSIEDANVHDILKSLQYVQVRLEHVFVENECGHRMKMELVERIDEMIKSCQMQIDKERTAETINQVRLRLSKIKKQNNEYETILSSMDECWSKIETLIKNNDETNDQELLKSLSTVSLLIEDDRLLLHDQILAKLKSALYSDEVVNEINELEDQTSRLLTRIKDHRALLSTVEDAFSFVKAYGELKMCIEALKTSMESCDPRQSGILNTFHSKLETLERIIVALQNLSDLHPETLDGISERELLISRFLKLRMESILACQNETMEILKSLETHKSEEHSEKLKQDFSLIRLDFQKIRTDIERVLAGDRHQGLNLQSRLKHLQKAISSLKSSSDANEQIKSAIESLESDLDKLSLRLSTHTNKVQMEAKQKTYYKILNECKKLILKLQDAAVITPSRSLAGIREYSEKVALLRVMVKVYRPSVERLLGLLETHKIEGPADQASLKERDQLERVWCNLCTKINSMDKESKIPLWNGILHKNPTDTKKPLENNRVKSRLPVYVGNSPERPINLHPSISPELKQLESIDTSHVIVETPRQGLIVEGFDKEDPLDQTLVSCIDSCPFTLQIIKVEKGKRGTFYEFSDFISNNSKKKIYCELRGNEVITRVGGGWEQLQEFLLNRYFLSMS